MIGNNETIAACATPQGQGGVAVIRISGPLVKEISKQLIGFIPKPRYAARCEVVNCSNKVIDDGLVLFFSGPNSFTGEDVLEIQGHGGIVLVDEILETILKKGVRLAKPGEFSERAFLNGKIDLLQAEAIADLINARSRQASHSAMRSLKGEFSKKINVLADKIIHLRLYIEAAIDFPEEEIDFIKESKVESNIKMLLSILLKIKEEAQQGCLLQEGASFVLLGKPNAGKSSLLNQLTGDERAIVTDIAGTTRDTLREKILIDGVPIQLIDTAGLRQSEDIVEAKGIERTKQEASNADVILIIHDETDSDKFEVSDYIGVTQKPVIIINNKIDLVEQREKNKGEVYLSAKTGAGIQDLKESIKKALGIHINEESVLLARRRHLDALARAEKHLQASLATMHLGELVAEELKLAHDVLGEIVGYFTTDQLLGEIFSSFCIGK